MSKYWIRYSTVFRTLTSRNQFETGGNVGSSHLEHLPSTCSSQQYSVRDNLGIRKFVYIIIGSRQAPRAPTARVHSGHKVVRHIRDRSSSSVLKASAAEAFVIVLRYVYSRFLNVESLSAATWFAPGHFISTSTECNLNVNSSFLRRWTCINLVLWYTQQSRVLNLRSTRLVCP